MRSTRTALADVRRAVLSNTSPFAEVLDMPIECRVQGRFSSRNTLQSVATSLRAALSWDCVGLSSKASGKHHRIMTFGASKLPPTYRVVIEQELILLREVKEEEAEKLATTFVAPRPPAPEVHLPAMDAEDEEDGVNGLIESACERRLASSEHMLEAKMKRWLAEVQGQVQASLKEIKETTQQSLDAQTIRQEAEAAEVRKDLQDSAKAMQAGTEAANKKWHLLERQMTELKTNCTEKFNSVDQTLSEQATSLQTSTASLKEQIRSVGAELMAQLATFQGDLRSSGAKKRRPNNDDAEMESRDGSTAGSHRGGMPLNADAVKLEELAERLRGVLGGHALLLPEVLGCDPPACTKIEDPDSRPLQGSSSASSASGLPSGIDENNNEQLKRKRSPHESGLLIQTRPTRRRRDTVEVGQGGRGDEGLKVLAGRCHDYTDGSAASSSTTRATTCPQGEKNSYPVHTLARDEEAQANAHRGGESVRLGTLNVGTLRSRELEATKLGATILSLQETCIAENIRSSVASTLRAVGASIVYGNIHAKDLRKRKKHQGVRLGTGVAIMACYPWTIAPVSGLWPHSHVDDQVSHRLVTGLAVHGEARLLCHCIYLDPQKNDNLDELVFQAVARRVAMIPHAHHWIAGDFQGESQKTGLGMAPASLGWLAHSMVMQEEYVTNWPHVGSPRILDDAWLSPNIAAMCTGARLERLAGWSTHALVEMDIQLTEQHNAMKVLSWSSRYTAERN